jgi:hypothetical protein
MVKFEFQFEIPLVEFEIPLTESSNVEAEAHQKLLAKAIDDFTSESGETPTLLLNLGDELSEGILCHDSVIKFKAPHLYRLLKSKMRETLALSCIIGRNCYSAGTVLSVSWIGLLYYLYHEELCHEVDGAGALELVTLALRFKLYGLARVVMEVMKVIRKDSWALVSGERENRENPFIASSVDMDVVFENRVVPPLIIHSSRKALDFWDFKGIRLSGKTPRQVGMVEKEINFVELDRKTVKLLSESSRELAVMVMIDFELSNLEIKKGVILSPAVSGGNFSWRIKIEFPKKVSKGRDSEIGMHLLCEDDHGGNEWYGDISGHFVVVNLLDRDKDIVKSVSSRLSDSEQSWGFSNMFKIKDTLGPDLGFVRSDSSSVILKARVLVDNFEISNPGVADIMKRRRRKQMKNGGVKVKRSNAKTTLTERKVDKLVKSKAKVDSHGDDNKEDFKQDICQSLSLSEVNEGDVACENVKVKEDDAKPEDKIASKTGAKKKKPAEKCHLPSCTENARHRCSACKGVRYCSQECSNHHWAEHREECRSIRERKERDEENGLD